jgi:hypothetical protein
MLKIQNGTSDWLLKKDFKRLNAYLAYLTVLFYTPGGQSLILFEIYSPAGNGNYTYTLD